MMTSFIGTTPKTINIFPSVKSYRIQQLLLLVNLILFIVNNNPGSAVLSYPVYLDSISNSSGAGAARIGTSADEDIDDGLCSLITITRNSYATGTTTTATGTNNKQQIAHLKFTEVSERSLVCSNIDETNYHQVMKNIYKRQKNAYIQNIHISNSDATVVLPAIDLICSQFNCSKLTVFNITGHQIHDCDKLADWLVSWPYLEILDLSNTSLKSIESLTPTHDDTPKLPSSIGSTQLKSLGQLFLDHNDISELNLNNILDRMPNLRTLSLVNNSIFDIVCSESLKPRVRSQLELINLAGNAINCDKAQLWFMKQFQIQQTNLKFPDYEKITCAAPERLIDMTWSQRVSVLETRICDSCDCKSLKKTAISVDCHNKNLRALPDVLPVNTKILNLTNNYITSMVVPQNSKNWENVTYVYLGNNWISSFQPLGMDSAKFIFRNLAALDIRRNKFQEFPSHIFEKFINLDQVYLSDNPWLCDCESTFNFQEWLQRQFHKVNDKDEIRCGVSGSELNGLRSNSLQQRLSSRIIYRLSKSELCPQESLEEPFDWLDALNFTLGLLIILIISKVILDYIYQHRTKRLPHFFRLNL